MKKFLTIALTALICFSFAACGGTAENQPVGKAPDNAEETVLTADSDSTETAEKDEQNSDELPPKVQDIRKFLALDTPYDVEEGTYGSMDFMYSLESGQDVLIQQFIDILIGEDYGLSIVDIYTHEYESATYRQYYLKYSGSGEDRIQNDDSEWDITIGVTVHKDTPEVTAGICYKLGFQLVDDGHRADYSKVIADTPATAPTYENDTKAEQSTPQKPAQNTAPAVTAVDKNASYIPDFTAFLNRSPSEDKDRYYGGTRKYYQKLPLDTQKSIVSEVLNLLDNDRYQLELIEKVDANNRIEYNYRYTGNVGMDSIHSKNDDSRYYNLQFTVYNKNNDNGTYGIHFHYAPQFTEENVGYTVSANITGGGGNGGGTANFEGGDLPEHSKLPCLTCDGSGDCDDCGGSIYVYVGGTRTKCNGCKGSGNCRTCGGSGTRG